MVSLRPIARWLTGGFVVLSACRAGSTPTPSTVVVSSEPPAAAPDLLDTDEIQPIVFDDDLDSNEDVRLLACDERASIVSIEALDAPATVAAIRGLLQRPLEDAFDRLDDEARMEGGRVVVQLVLEEGRLAADAAKVEGPSALADCVRAGLRRHDRAAIDDAPRLVTLEVSFHEHSARAHCPSTTPFVGLIRAR